VSNTASWSYTNTATVKPFVSIDLMSGVTVYGAEFQIACTWTAESTQHRDSNGAEFVSRHVVFTEDARPKHLDLISFDGSNGWQEIRSVTNWDMSPFGETPDFKLVT